MMGNRVPTGKASTLRSAPVDRRTDNPAPTVPARSVLHEQGRGVTVRRRVLSIDPGIDTGWAVLDGPPYTVVKTGTVHENDFLDGLMWWSGFDPDIVIIEFVLLLTNSELNQRLERIGSALRKLFPDANYVRPGQWKPVTGHLPMPPAFSGTRHERDAVRMAWWWLRKNGL